MNIVTSISSNNISVFPLSKNRPNDRSARLFYEHNIANLIRQLIDVEGFIIQPSSSTDLSLSVSTDGDKIIIRTGTPITFNLYGYYFSIAANSSLLTVNANELDASGGNNIIKLFAVLNIDDKSNEIAGYDDNGVYTGLKITTDSIDAVDSTGRHAIELCSILITLDLDAGKWVVSGTMCDSSYSRFSTQSLDMSISRIDGKH